MSLFMMETPAELQLKARIAQLEREVAELKHELQISPRAVMAIEDADLGYVPMPETLRLEKRGQVEGRFTEYYPRQLGVTARTMEPGGQGISVAYFANSYELRDNRWRGQLLSFLHERFVRTLAEHLAKEVAS